MKYFFIIFILLVQVAFGQQKIDRLISKEIVINGKLDVNSSTMASSPCPPMTKTQRDAIVSPSIGDCVYNTTDNTDDHFNGSTWSPSTLGAIPSQRILYGDGTGTPDNSGDFTFDESSNDLRVGASTSGGDGDLYLGDGSSTGGFGRVFGGGGGLELNGNGGTVTLKTGSTTALTATNNDVSIADSLTASGNITGANFSGTSLVLGGTINANAIADFQSTSKAFMPPRMTNAQVLAIPSPTAGMVAYDTTYSTPIYYNGTAWTFGFGSVQLDNTYGAESASTGTVSKENKDFISGNCTNASPSVCTFTSGVFTTAPNCQVTPIAGGSNFCIATTTSTDLSITCYSDGGGAATTSTSKAISCQKTGNDYISSSSNIFASSSTSQIALATEFSAAASNTGTVSNESLDWINGNCTNASPSVCTFQSGIFTVTPNCSVTNATNSTNFTYISAISSSSISVGFSSDSGATTQTAFHLKCQRQGVDYQSAAKPFIVGSFEGMAKFLGYTQVVGPTAADGSIPADNTIPQVGEGTQIMTVTITPLNIGHKLHVYANVKATEETNQGETITLALFRNGASNAVAADVIDGVDAAPNLVNGRLIIEYSETVASLDPITFTLRIGGGSLSDIVLNESVNSSGTDQTAGGIISSWMKVTQEPY